jgi:hypothetical protein
MYVLCRWQDPEAGEYLVDVALLDAKIAEATAAMAKAETTSEKRKARERREDLMRLKRVEQIYVSICTSDMFITQFYLVHRVPSFPFCQAGFLCC